MLEGKKILLAVCGSIAAYKTAFFVRLLIKAGAEVKVIMTTSATNFITPLTLATLSKQPVLTDFYKQEGGEWNNHVELGLWADLMVVAPLSAHTLAKMAHGICDNLLAATFLSARCPVLVCPAMDLDMYRHPSTQANLQLIKSYGNHILDPEDGELASGLHGQGRMAEPEHIVAHIEALFLQTKSLQGKNILITSGPTQEAIDPVRFIGNHSTGKMGHALATELAKRGAKIDFISGPVGHYPKHQNITVHQVTTALEMYEAARKIFPSTHVAIFAAAVADYRPSQVANQKIKKSDESLAINLLPNPDIASELGMIKTKQLTVGFALETENEESNAQNKLQKKNLDLIVLNSLRNEGAGFAHNTNQVSVYDKQNKITHFELKTKTEVAVDLANMIEQKLHA